MYIVEFYYQIIKLLVELSNILLKSFNQIFHSESVACWIFGLFEYVEVLVKE